MRGQLVIDSPIHPGGYFFGELVKGPVSPCHDHVSFLDPVLRKCLSLARWLSPSSAREAHCPRPCGAAHRPLRGIASRRSASRCSASRRVTPCHTAARHADRWYSRCDARPFYFRRRNPRRILSSASPNVHRKQSRLRSPRLADEYIIYTCV